MKRHIAFLIMLALAPGCAKQDDEPGNLLDLADEPAPAMSGAGPTDTLATSVTTPDGNAKAVLAVARALAARRGADPVEIGRFCDDNAQAFKSQADVHVCKALARSTAALVPVPTSIEEMATIAATLPVKDRAVFCTSTAALKLTQTVEDYDRCFPPSVRAQFEAMGGMDSIEDQDTAMTQDELKEQVLRDAGHLSEIERQMYCNVASVRATMEGDTRSCLAGLSPGDASATPLTDDDPGYRDEGH